jgi:O-antigen/teichoic acid export membrane protein
MDNFRNVSIGKLLKGRDLKDFALYFFSSVMMKSIPFFLLPILTLYLSPAEYGLISLYQVLLSFSGALVGMSLQTNVTRNYFKKDRKYLSELVFNLLLISLASSVVVSLLIRAYLFFDAPRFDIPVRWFFALPVISFFQMIVVMNLSILRNQKKAQVFGVFEISRSVIEMGLTSWFIIISMKSWQGRLYGISLAYLIMGILSLIFMYRRGFLRMSIDIEKIRDSLGVSLPLIPHIMGGIILTK